MRQALEMALEVLGESQQILDEYATEFIFTRQKNNDAIAAIKEALAQPEQEPVAWVNWCAATGKRSVSFECESELASQPLYTKEQS